MNNRIIGFIVLVLLVGLVIFGIVYFRHRQNNQTDNNTPVLSISAYNQDQKADATAKTANANDVIVFTLTAENPTDKTITGYVMEANIADVTNKSTLVDAQGASYNAGTNSLVWTPLDISAGNSIQKQFSVRVNAPAANSTDTVMKIKFNNEIMVAIKPNATVSGSNTNSPPPSYQAPVTGPSGGLIVWLAIFVTGIYAAIRKSRTSLGDN